MPVTTAACLSVFLSAGVAVPFSNTLAITEGDLLLLAVFGLTHSVLGFALFTLGARKLPAIETALIGALDAPLAPVWVWIAFAETPASATLAGGAIVLVAVIGHILTATARSTA